MPGKAAVDKAAEHQRWERNSRWARRVGSAIGGSVERWIERFLIRRAWRNAQPERLQRYLVGGFQNPVINVQSILARHELIRELYGDVHADLMTEELQLGRRQTSRVLSAAPAVGRDDG